MTTDCWTKKGITALSNKLCVTANSQQLPVYFREMWLLPLVLRNGISISIHIVLGPLTLRYSRSLPTAPPAAQDSVQGLILTVSIPWLKFSVPWKLKNDVKPSKVIKLCTTIIEFHHIFILKEYAWKYIMQTNYFITILSGGASRKNSQSFSLVFFCALLLGWRGFSKNLYLQSFYREHSRTFFTVSFVENNLQKLFLVFGTRWYFQIEVFFFFGSIVFIFL